MNRRRMLATCLLTMAATAGRFPLLAGETLEQRRARLLVQARNEGPLLIYHIVPTESIADLAQRYRDKYDLEVVLWKGSNEGITQRIFAETRADKQQFDLVQLSASIQAIYDAGALGEIEPVIGRTLPDEFMADHGQWFVSHSVAFVFAYNTDLVSPENVPTSFQDLSKPFWADKVAFSQGADAAWIATMYREMGETNADAFFAQMASAGVQVRRSYTLLGSLLAAGEFYGTPHMFLHTAEKLKADGAPVDFVTFDPVVTINHVWSIAKQIKRPASLALFFDLLMEEGESNFVDKGYLSNADRMFPGTETPLAFVDFEVEQLSSARDWRARYAQFLRDSRN